MKNRLYISLLLILLLALFLRIYQLNTVPVELFGDEIDVGIQAFSILETGKDYSGNTFPLMFRSFTENRLPVFIYSAVPTVAIFGLNEWGVRLTGVLWGMLGILGCFLLVRKLLTLMQFKYAQFAAVLSALLMAISPWHIQYSRTGGTESGALLALTLFGIWAFLNGLQKRNWLIFSSVVFALTFYTYATAIIFTPLIILLLLITFQKNIWVTKTNLLIFIGTLVILLLPFLTFYFQGKASARFSTIALWSDSTLVDEINRRRLIEGTPLASLSHNKPQIYLHEFNGNYLKSLSLEFLYFKGDPNLRHSVGGIGEFYLFELILLLIGIRQLIVSNSPYKTLLFGWILIAPISSALTRDGSYHASRLIMLFPPLTIISALGFAVLLQSLKSRMRVLSLIALVLLASLNIFNYLHRYYEEWPYDSWKFWQYGYKESLSFLKKNDQNWSRVYINNTYETALPRFMFWYQYPSGKIQPLAHQIAVQPDDTPDFEGFQIDNKYFFGTVPGNEKGEAISDLLKPNEVYMASVRNEAKGADWTINPPSKIKVIKTIKSPSDEPIFYIVQKE